MNFLELSSKRIERILGRPRDEDKDETIDIETICLVRVKYTLYYKNGVFEIGRG